MYERYLDVAATYQMVPLMGGLDYRASPDWAGKLGISPEGLRDYQLRSIEFLRDEMHACAVIAVARFEAALMRVQAPILR